MELHDLVASLLHRQHDVGAVQGVDERGPVGAAEKEALVEPELVEELPGLRVGRPALDAEEDGRPGPARKVVDRRLQKCALDVLLHLVHHPGLDPLSRHRHVFAQNNFEVNLVDVNAAQLEKALQTISKNFDRQVAKGVIADDVKKQFLANISTFTSIKEGVQDADIVVEAATENVELKLKIFKEIDEAAAASSPLASNTSSISITKIAAATKRPEKVIGMS